MKPLSVSTPRLAVCCFISITLVGSISARQISLSPLVDSLNIVGSCTPAEMICTLAESSLGYDTIAVKSHYGDPLCTGYPPNQANIISAFYFIIHDTSDHFRYELWLCPTLYDTARILPFSATFMPSPQLYYMVLKVYVGTALVDSARMKLRSITTGLSVELTGNLLPSGVVLEQNYPNPFNPSTSVSYFIPSAAHVSLKVFNLGGQEVADLINTYKSAGHYTVQWNAQHLPSGIYFCRLRSGNYSQTMKLCLLK